MLDDVIGPSTCAEVLAAVGLFYAELVPSYHLHLSPTGRVRVYMLREWYMVVLVESTVLHSYPPTMNKVWCGFAECILRWAVFSVRVSMVC